MRIRVAAALCLVLAGCGGSVQSRAFESGGSAASGAAANVRGAIPALEAYYADNGTYAGATIAKLRTTYDAGLVDPVRIVRADDRTYCLESTVGGTTASKHGPAAEITPGGC